MTRTYTDLMRAQTWLQAILESAAEVAILGRAIRAPENATLGIADLLGLPDRASAPRGQPEIFKRAGANLLTLVNDILDLSTIEAGHFELEKIEFELCRLLGRTFALIDTEAQAKNLELKWFVAPGTPDAHVGDPRRLQQILAKLLGDAVNLAQAGEAITLTVAADPADREHLHFELNGGGTREENRAFGDVIQAENSKTRLFEEIGLDLEFCRALVRKMGGELCVRSKTGKPSLLAFDVRFPSDPKGESLCSELVSDSEYQDELTTKKVASEAADKPVVRVLIAEDSIDSRFLLQEFLKKGPYEITFAENGKVAVEAARSHSFDLILMDIQMPVMDGLTATRLIRKAEREAGRAPTPLLALTANARKLDIELSRAAGCNAHVLKPISRQELLKTIQTYAPGEAVQKEPPAVRVSIPAGLEEAAKRYIRSRKNDVPRLTQLVEAKEFEQLRILAHELKGTGTSYGFPDLSRLGGLMEGSAKAGNQPELSSQLLEFSRYVQEASELIAVTR